VQRDDQLVDGLLPPPGGGSGTDLLDGAGREPVSEAAGQAAHRRGELALLFARPGHPDLIPAPGNLRTRGQAQVLQRLTQHTHAAPHR
jgi:hypothetical protein